MAIEFARTTIISRGDGHSAIKAAAYRAGEKLQDERLGRVSDYSHRNDEVICSEILLPEGADQTYLDRQTLWTAVEDREDRHNRRASAQLAKDHVISLPKELNKEQQIELAKNFAQQEFVSRGLVVDLNIHYHSDGNPHAHMMTTTRALEGRTFGLKDREANGDFYCNDAKITDAEQLRHRWASFQNTYFRENDIDLNVVNNEGELERKSELKRTENNNVDGDSVQKDASLSGRAAALFESPEIIIKRVADRKSIFTRHDLYRELHTLVDNIESYSAIKERLQNHSDLISIGITAGKKDLFTSRTVVETEKKIGETGAQLTKQNNRFGAPEGIINAALSKQSSLSAEQKDAVRFTLDNNRLACVVGLAGAGKSTMLFSMREASENAGHQVFGIALAGKAAEELTKSSGIESRTIASFIHGVNSGKLEIKTGDIVVMDEAGMVNDRTMLDVMSVVNQSGAKLVMVGDAEQLQPIQAGSPFKRLTEKFGSVNIETIRRQKAEWQRNATFDLAKGRGIDALKAYDEAGFVHSDAKHDVVDRLVDDYTENLKNDVSQAILAHRNADVKAINTLVRAKLKSQNKLKSGRTFNAGQASTNAGIPLGTRIGDTLIFDESSSEMGYNAADRGTYMGEQRGMHTVYLDSGAQLSFAAETAPMLRLEEDQLPSQIELSDGDRILFTKNNKLMGVKNGMLGTLVSYEGNDVSVALDDGGVVKFTSSDYSNIDHGYATTIHKSQGVTVDKAYLLGSNTMDKHLGYVGMSRHRDTLNVYLPTEDFERKSFGGLLNKTNHQESVLDLVEKRGLSYDESDIGKTEFYNPQPSVDVEMAMNASVAASTEDVIIGDEAHQTIESTRSSLVDKTNNNAGLTIKEAGRSLDKHRSDEPKQGVFGGEAMHRGWSVQLVSPKQESANNEFLDEKNGMPGTLISYEVNSMSVALDGDGIVDLTSGDYANIDHDYATNLHETQGMTIESTYLLGSNTMDENLEHAGISHDRDTFNAYLPTDEFEKSHFSSMLNNTAHQVSVLDLAEQQGLVYDETDIGKTQFYNPTPSGDGEMAMNTAVASSTEEVITIDEAHRTLESTRLSLVDKMNNDAALTIKEAERSARIAERSIDKHRIDEPKQGIFASKAKHQAWSDKLESLEQESASARKTVSNLKTELDSNQEKFSREARKEAVSRHPVEADIVKTHQSQERAVDSLNRIKTILKDITELDGEDRRASRMDTLHSKLDRALKDLSADRTAKEKLTPDQVKSVKEASMKLQQGKRVREIEEQSRGGHEL